MRAAMTRSFALALVLSTGAGGCTALLDLDELNGTGGGGEGGVDSGAPGSDGGGSRDGSGGGSDGGSGGTDLGPPVTMLSFAASTVSLANDSRAYDLRLGDLNGDGKLDVALADDGPELLLLFDLLDPGGTLPTVKSQATCSESTRFVLEDLDDDQKLDAVVTCGSSSLEDSGVTRLVNQGNDANALPTWTRSDLATGMAPNGFYARDAFVVDLDRDGKLDTIVADHSAPTTVIDKTKAYVTVFYGDGTTSHYATSWDDGDIDAMEVVDVDGDQRPDVVLVSSYTSEVLVLANQGTTHSNLLTAGSPISVPNLDGTMTVGDANGDGKVDLFLSAFDENAFYYLQGKGDGTFVAKKKTTDAGPESIAVGDLNRDGELDVAVGTLNPANQDYEAHVDVFLGDGAGNFADKVDVSGSLPFQGSSIAIGDLDGDGLAEIVLGSQNHARLYVFQNTSH